MALARFLSSGLRSSTMRSRVTPRMPFRQVRMTPRFLSDACVSHRDSAVNNTSIPFEWDEDSQAEIKKIMARYPPYGQQSACMPLLVLAQEQEGQNNWLSISAMNKVAEMLDMPPIRVYEVATFYTQYNREPVGKFHLQVCGTTPCMLCGSKEIINTLCKELGIKSGDTTADGLFTVQEVECLGACANAPMIQVNNRWFYENLTPESTIQLLEDLKNGKAQPGPQNGQKDCEGPMGQTSLLTQPELQFRDIDALLAEVAAKKEEKAQ